jgi:hypothetical protein
MIANRNAAEPDIVLVGAGIMSATLGTVLKELEPTLNIVLLETLHDCLCAPLHCNRTDVTSEHHQSHLLAITCASKSVSGCFPPIARAPGSPR